MAKCKYCNKKVTHKTHLYSIIVCKECRCSHIQMDCPEGSYYFYNLTDDDNNPIYAGYTYDPDTRFRSHCLTKVFTNMVIKSSFETEEQAIEYERVYLKETNHELNRTFKRKV